MAADTTFDTYKSVGIREDLIDVIYDISPTDTPFVSNVGSGSAKGTFHEWQQDALEAPDGTPVPEGADASPTALLPTTRLGNYCQINERTWVISGTDLVADNAGRGVEMAYQEAKKGLELRKSIEYHNVFDNNVGAIGTGNDPGAATARVSGTVQSWISENTNFDATTGVMPTNMGQTGWTTRVVSSATRPFTEALLEDVVDRVYLEGGNPDTLMANTQQKRIISKTFTGSATDKNISVPDKRVINAVDFYESDYGVLSIVPNRYMPQDSVYVLDTDMWEVAYHRPFNTYDLAKSGDNEKKQMIVEWTLVSKEEASGGAIYDLTAV
jgi:hypothetical protein